MNKALTLTIMLIIGLGIASIDLLIEIIVSAFKKYKFNKDIKKVMNEKLVFEFMKVENSLFMQRIMGDKKLLRLFKNGQKLLEEAD